MLSQINYFNGNGNNGFGGFLGESGLEINFKDSDPSKTFFILTPGGTGVFNDKVVIYIDSDQSGNFTNTYGFTDTGDPLRIAISGFNGIEAQRAGIDFPPGFEADYAIGIESANGGFAGLWRLTNGGSHAFFEDLSYFFDGSDYYFELTNTNIGDPNSFKFFATYISATAFRSDEAIGDINAFAGNPGNTGVQFDTYWTTDALVGGYVSTNSPATVWSNDSSWGFGNVPFDTDFVTINNNIIVDTDVTVGFLSINSPNSVTVNSGKSVTVSENFSNSGTFTANSGSSLIVGGTSSGNIIYNRTIPTGGTNPADFYLISSPVIGQDIDAFAAAEGLAVGTGSNRGLGDYNNSTPGWEYYQDGASGTGNFISGEGRALSLAAAGDVSFTGTMPVSDVGNSITSNTNGYNLIGNPYPSYIAANDPADGANNLLKVNDTDNDFLTESTIWLWNELTDTYDIINHASAFYIAPAQGFFVSSNGSHTFSITEAMQSHQTGDSFQRITSDRPEIQLVLTDGSATRDTDIFYINGTTTGFDNGYDSSIFGGVANSFAVYTHVVANGQGRDLGIQSLPNSDFENMIIPVGVNAISGSTLSFTANIQNLPQGIHVYLEDALTNTFTQLNSAGGEYNITINNDMSGIGRFYLRTTSQALGFDNVIMMDHVSIYSNEDNSILNIAGLDDGKTRLNLFDLTGKLIMETTFNSNRFNTVSLPELNSGIYIVKLESENGILNKKILID